MQDPQHSDENADVADNAECGDEMDSRAREPTDADPLLPEVAQ